MRLITIENNFVFAGGVKIARLLPKERALEFMEPLSRSGNCRGQERRRVVVPLEALAGLCAGDGGNDGGVY